MSEYLAFLEVRSPIKTPLKKHVNFTSVLLLQAILCMQRFRYKLQSKNRTKPQSVVWVWDFSTYLPCSVKTGSELSTW